MTADPFDIDGLVPVSPRLATARRIVLALEYLLVIAGGVAIAISPLDVLWLVAYATVAIVAFVWVWWLIGRRVIVPYGRMQMVDLTAGPIDRWLGISTVQLHTAAATTDATIPGLLPVDAASLRDRLAARGEERNAGL